jgi:hypothetical protein
MPVSRAFSPLVGRDAESATDSPPPHPFPMWPFALTAYADHCSRDYGDYLDRLSKADDAAAVVRAEEAFGLNLLSDINQAFYALVWAPLDAAAAAAPRRAPPDL